MALPETRYAKSGDVHIAWSAGGQGTEDILYCSMWTSHVEAFWDWAPFARVIRRLATFGRVILFDLPGNGLSDPVSPSELPTIEQWMDYVRIVLDAAGSERAVFFASSMAGGLAIPFVATHPDRVRALVLYDAFARIHRADDYPFGPPPEHRDKGVQWFLERWGTGRQVELTAPSVADDPYEIELMGRAERHSASPGVAKAFFNMIADMDVRDVLPAVHVPTLVLHRAGDRWVRPEHGRYLAEHIPGARYVELPGENHHAFYGDTDRVIAETRSFLATLPEPAEVDRVLATILFTDIVGSTERAAAIGDRRWAELLDAHHALVRQQLERFRGREIDTAGDGFLATFDGPARAIKCACAIRDAVEGIGLKIRAGLHTGEVDVTGGDLRGIAVHIGARVGASAGPGEVLVSRTVADLVAGSGIGFADRGVHELKGVPGSWQLLVVQSLSD